MMAEARVTTHVAEDKMDVPSQFMEDGLEMEPFRCPKCGKFLCYQAIVIGAIRAKCKKCRRWITLDIIPPPDILEIEVSDNGLDIIPPPDIIEEQ